METPKLNQINKYMKMINTTFSLLGGWFLITIMAINVYEVIARYVFNAPTIWTVEISTYLMLISVFLAAAYTLQEGGHTKVDFLISRLSTKNRRIIDIITSILGIIFVVVLVWKSTELALFTHTIGSKSMTQLAIPLFPIYIIVPIGSFILLLQYFLQLYAIILERE